MKYVITGVGIISIIIITIFNFYGDDIREVFAKEEKIVVTVNDYYLDTNFNFLENYTDDATNKQELLNYIYYIVNSGANEADGFCSYEYKECISDLETMANNMELLSIINNFVHPYNSFDKITFTYNEKGKFNIKVQRIYSKEEIEQINKRIDEIIQQNITSNMNTYDKIKVIHDYIIDTTTYDTLKTANINDTTHKSNTAYGPIIEGYAICSGYSDAMAIVLDKLGIDNYKISNETHIWNLVKVGGKWLHLDLTWDDPIYETNINRDTYFLIDTTTLNNLKDKTHNFDHNIFSEAN